MKRLIALALALLSICGSAAAQYTGSVDNVKLFEYLMETTGFTDLPEPYLIDNDIVYIWRDITISFQTEGNEAVTGFLASDTAPDALMLMVAYDLATAISFEYCNPLDAYRYYLYDGHGYARYLNAWQFSIKKEDGTLYIIFTSYTPKQR